MSARSRTCSFVLVLALASSCYTVAVPDTKARVGALGLPGRVVVDERSAQLEVAFRSGHAGLANRYVIEIGEGFARYAEQLLGTALAGEGERVVVRAQLEEASVREFVVHLTASFEVELEGRAPYRERYVIEGPRYFEGTYDVEPRAVVLGLERSAHDALVLAFQEFAADLRERLAER